MPSSHGPLPSGEDRRALAGAEGAWGTMLARSDEAGADIAVVEARIEQVIALFATVVARLDEITGLGPSGAATVIAEVGLDMSRFPTPGHLCSWARFAAGVRGSAGKKKGRGGTGHGNRYLGQVLGEAAVAAGRTNTPPSP